MNDHPAIAGFHPDPSICRMGDEYVLVTSSFEYAPGVPVFTSRNLVDWHQVGNVLDQPSQLTVRGGIGGASGGIYAPTVRYHDGRLWMTTTNVHDIASGHLIVHATDPAGPWSDPVYTTGLIGIDPDMAWGEDGVCRLTWSDVINGGISQAEINPESGEVLSTPKEIWRGTGGAHAEGPHVFSRGDWWYLVAAEGGTAAGHMVTIARSASIDGPYESAPGNPILTHRSTALAVQATGHGDVVERSDGEWAMVHLGIRQRGSFPRWHTNGRETFLVGLDWADDWPAIDENRYEVPVRGSGFTDEFTGPALDSRWVSPGAFPSHFAFPGSRGLQLLAGRAPHERESSRLLVVRATDLAWEVSVTSGGDLALVVRIDDAHQAMVERVGDAVSARVVIGPVDQILGSATAPAGARLSVRAAPFDGERGQRQGPDRLLLGFETDEGGFAELADVDGRYLSTEVAGGFTGRVVGVEALGADATVSRFEYRTS